jgi:hypothetical protein
MRNNVDAPVMSRAGALLVGAGISGVSGDDEESLVL